MGHVIYDDLSLKRFLRLPEAKPALEYIDGKVVQKVAAKRAHSVMQTMLGVELLQFVRERGLGLAYVELRTTFGGYSIVPDVCVFRRDRLPSDEDVMEPPDLAIEVISPGQTVRDLSAKLRWCVEHGVALGWLIRPRRRTAFVFRPGQPVEELDERGTLSGEGVVPGFALPLATLFGWLDGP